MTTTLFLMRFERAESYDTAEGRRVRVVYAHGTVELCKGDADAPRGWLHATLAFEALRPVGCAMLLESPTYDQVFAVGEEKRALRCLKAAARRRGLHRVQSNNQVLLQRATAQFQPAQG